MDDDALREETEHTDRFAAASEADGWDAEPEYAGYVLSLAGLSSDEGPEQHTRIGGEEVWARVWIDKRGNYVVRFPTRVRGRRSLCLTEVYAMQRASAWWHLRRPEQARWQTAALAEAKQLSPPTVRLQALPADAPEIFQTLWRYIEELVAIRRVREPDEPRLPLVASFLVHWCRATLTEAEIARAKLWLERLAYITRDGEHPSASPVRRPTILWTVAEIEASTNLNGNRP